VTENYLGFYGIPKSHGLIACALTLHFHVMGSMPKQKEGNFQTLPAMSGAVPCTASISASPLSPILPLEKEEKEKKPDQINQSITKNNSSFFHVKQGAISVITPVQLQTETCIVIYF
jgi:hypothetical protein